MKWESYRIEIESQGIRTQTPFDFSDCPIFTYLSAIVEKNVLPLFVRGNGRENSLRESI